MGNDLSMQIVDVEPDDPRLIDDLLPVLLELRPHLTAESLQAVYDEGRPQGLRFSAGYVDGRCVAVAGWRILATTAFLRKLYVDDLVTASEHRSQGAGQALLADLTRRAREAGCLVVDLDSATHRLDAHRFYMRERFPIAGFHFVRHLD
jgi:GNAT superfamily N-acetyltransferase